LSPLDTSTALPIATAAEFDDWMTANAATAREILAFLELPWSEQCMAFHENPREVQTASREQVRLRLLRCLARLARRWEDAKQPEAAAECYLRLIEADPLFEAPYRNLMLCYQRAGDLVEARTSYERLRTLLQARLKAAPSPETQAVYAGLKASGP